MQILSIPARGFQLLVPVSMVAQVIARVASTPTALEIQGLDGMIRWNDLRLPLFRTSELMGGKPSDDGDYRQIVVLWPMRSAGRQSYLALTSLDTPEVVPAADWLEAEGVMPRPWALAYAAMPNGLGVIPDLDALARRAWLPDHEGVAPL